MSKAKPRIAFCPKRRKWYCSVSARQVFVNDELQVKWDVRDQCGSSSYDWRQAYHKWRRVFDPNFRSRIEQQAKELLRNFRLVMR